MYWSLNILDNTWTSTMIESWLRRKTCSNNKLATPLLLICKCCKWFTNTRYWEFTCNQVELPGPKYECCNQLAPPWKEKGKEHEHFSIYLPHNCTHPLSIFLSKEAMLPCPFPAQRSSSKSNNAIPWTRCKHFSRNIKLFFAFMWFFLTICQIPF